MNDGGRANMNEVDKRQKRAVSSEFGRAVARVAVAQICERVGYHSINESALEALADIVIRFVRDLGKTANFYANVANRTECNVFDVIQGLEDFGSSAGFSNGSEVHTSFMGSGAMKDIMEYVELIEEVAFAQPVPSFPIVRARRVTPSFAQMGETPGFKHVPDWLPAFPDPHTYIHSPVWNERVSDPRSDKVELARQRRKAENSLLSLQQRLVSNGLAVASTSDIVDGSKKSLLLAAGVAADGKTGSTVAKSENPYLPPSGEGDISSVVLPTKLLNKPLVENQVSILDTFVPVIEAVSSKVSELGEDGERDLPDKRPSVRLNFNSGRKMIGDSLDLRLWNRGTGRISSWFGRDDVMDDKKRRAELILRQSMENPLELPQL